jgi:hypothetical protein
MFVRGEARLEVSFADAQARLADLTRVGWLLDASREAYDQGTAGLVELAPSGSARAMSRLVAAHWRNLAGPGGPARLALR